MLKTILQFSVLLFANITLAQSVYPIKQAQKWGLINAQGRVVAQAEYDAIDVFENFGYATVQKNTKIGLLNADGKLLIPTIYDDLKLVDSLVLEGLQKGEWTLMNLQQKTLLRDYERVQPLGDYIRYLKDEKWGLVDRKGTILVEPNFEHIYLRKHFIQTRNKDKIGAIALNGTPLISTRAARIIALSSDLFLFQEAELWGAVDGKGKTLFEPQFETYQKLSSQFVKLNYQGKSQVYSTETKQMIGGIYDDFIPFSKDYLLVRRQAKLGLIDKTGQSILPSKYYDIKAFNKDLFRVNLGNKWGIINLSEASILPFQYNFISPLRDNMALVMQAGRFGAINKQGKLIIPCEYSKIEHEGQQIRAFKGEAMQSFTIDGNGNLNTSEEYEEHFSFKIRGKDQKRRAITVENNTQLDQFEWFYAPEEKRWGLRDLRNGTIALEPKFDFIRIEKDFGFTLVGITKYSKLSFDRTTYRFDTAYGVVNNEIGKLVTKIQFLDIRIEDFERGYPLARCVFLNGKHGLIARSGQIIQSDLTYVGAFRDSVARVSTYGKLSGSLEAKEGLGVVSDYLDGMQSSNVMIDYTLHDQAFETEAVLTCENCTWGYINAAGKYIVDAQYSVAQPFKKQVGIVAKDGKWGVVNHKNKEIIPCKYSAVQFLEKTDNSIIRVFNATPKYGVIDTLGKLKVDAIFEEVGMYSEEKLAIKKGNQWGYANADGTILVPCKYKKARAFSEGLAAVKVENRWGFINGSGEMVVHPQFIRVGDFTDELAWVHTSKGSGYINKEGQVIIEATFDKAFDFFKGTARVGIEGKYGLINREGDFLARPRFTDIRPFNEFGLAVVRYGDERVRYGVVNLQGELITDQAYRAVYPYSEGLAIVKTKDGLGYINAQGTLVIAPKYSKASNFSSGRAAVQKEGVCGYIDRLGNPVVDFEYSKCLDFNGDRAVVYKGYRKSGVLDVQGEYVIEPSLDRLLGFDEGRGLMRDRQYRFYYITESAEVYDGYYQEARRFQNGVAVVRLGDKWGIVNQKGINVIPPKYDKIEDFEGGYARVRVKGFYGLTNLQGEFIVSPDFEHISYAGGGIFRAEKGNAIGYFNARGKWIWKMSE